MPDQPELRKLLIEVLIEHSYDHYYGACRCERDPGSWYANAAAMTLEQHRAHIADRLLALPGIAIVPLPETSQNWWPVVHGGEPEQVYLAHEPNDGEQIVCISGAGYCYVDEARSVAAALLAAAGVAEEQTNA